MWLSPGLGRRRLSVRGAKLRLREPLHHGAVLAVTVPAAALLLAAVLGHHVVVAAIVTEDASAEPKKKKKMVSWYENMKQASPLHPMKASRNVSSS